MGRLVISKNLVGSEIEDIAFSFLRRECHANFLCDTPLLNGDVEYDVEGKDIPLGSAEFSLRFTEIVKDVFIITIE